MQSSKASNWTRPAKTWNSAGLFVIMTALALPSFAQMGGAGPAQMQQKLAALKQSAAANKQRLHHYQWMETTQLKLKGEMKPPREQMCSYGPDGQVQKVPVGGPPPPPSGGRFKQRIVEKKTAEMKDYMGQVQSLLALYVPPDPQRMQRAYQAGNVSLNKTLGTNVTQLVFKDYAQPGDQMTVAFDSGSKKIQTLNVNTYLDEPKDVVTLAVQFASLPDGTNYAQQSVLNATAKQLQVTTTNSNYTRLR